MDSVYRTSKLPDGVEAEDIYSALEDRFEGIKTIGLGDDGTAVITSMKWYPNKELEDEIDDKLGCSIRVDPFLMSISSGPDRPGTILAAESILADALEVMRAKNADYGDSWREMRLPSITDQILVKVMRIRSIEESGGPPKVSEGVESEYRDIINYCVFALIKLQGG